MFTFFPFSHQSSDKFFFFFCILFYKSALQYFIKILNVPDTLTDLAIKLVPLVENLFLKY